MFTMKRSLKPIAKSNITRALCNTAWDLGNETLYALCRSHPLHNRPDAVIAKVWLIGRAYAAAIERRKQPTSYGDAYYVEQVAPAIIASGIDDWIASIPASAPSDATAHGTAITVHHRLTQLFGTISHQQKRSLASKYLHFHRPNSFFIYDTRAIAAIRRATPPARHAPPIDADEAEREYAPFYRRCLWLQQKILSQHGLSVSPRQLDKVLLFDYE